jgi:hypothetical protein
MSTTTRVTKKYKALYLKEVADHAEYRRQIQNATDERNRPVLEKLWTGTQRFFLSDRSIA